MKQYQKYHKHTSFSNVYTKDSPLVVRDYLEAFKKEGGRQIYSTVEHGFQSPYFRVYDEIEQFNRDNGTNIKFVFGAEIYWVKDRFSNDKSNCHMVLLAKNDRGRKAINKAISIANKTGYYYKPRLDLELILNLPKDDVFVTTACLAFWNRYEDIDDIVLQLNYHFTDFYLEVQAHNTTLQKDLNKHILELSKEYGIPLIAGTDTHILNEQHEEDRNDLLKSAKIEYNSDEDGWTMDMPSYDEFVRRFEEQGVLSYDEIITAIENTNLILDFEDIKLDRSIKIPTLYPELNQEEKDRVFIKRIFDLWEEESKKIAPLKHDYYKSEIIKELQEIIGCSMCDYFLTNEKIIKLAIEKYDGEITQSGRGSNIAMYINKLLGFTNIDRISAPIDMYYERFLTKERVLESKTPPDEDFNVSKREPFIQAQRELLGETSCYDLIAFGTLKFKSAFKMYARANNIEPQVANEVTKQIDKYEKAFLYAEEDEKEFVNIFDYVNKEEFGYIIEGCKRYLGIVDTRKAHPCFTENELVMTSIGYKKISEIEIGDYVLTHNNKFEKVVELMRNKSDDLYKLNVMGSPIIEVTGNHPIFIGRRNSKRDKKDITKMWVSVDELEKGDMVGIAINQNSIVPLVGGLPTSNKDFWWIVGRFIGDGWCENFKRKSGKRAGATVRRTIICCGKNDKDLSDIESKLKGIFDYRIQEERTIYKIIIKSRDFHEYMRGFGKYAGGKYLTKEILDLPVELLRHFLEGYFSADGHFNEKTGEQKLSTISKKLALGVISCVNKAYKRPCGLTVRERTNSVIEGRLVNSQDCYVVSFRYDERPKDKSYYKDGYIWTPYYSRENMSGEYDVYNIEVENDHSYTVNNLIVHNCGSLVSSCDIEEEVGIILCKSETTGKEVLTALIESGTIDSFGWLKNDFLIVDSTRIINAVYKRIGMKPIEINDLLEMIKDDNKVWDIYSKGYAQCINQVEQPKTTQKTMRYKPRNIVELTKFISSIRPSFKSLYSKFESRERYQYDIPVLDKLLQNEYSDSSFILFQEDLMKILNFAGFPMKDTYTIIKAISKKKKKIISKVKPKFIKTFAEHILAEGSTDGEANAIAEKIWGIVEDFSSYGFNSPHGFSYAVDSVTQAWQKAHYPYEFYEVVLQRFTEKGEKAKVSLIKQEMKHFNIKLKPMKFRDDNRTFTSYKEKGYITQPLNNVKSISKTTPDALYELRNLEVNNFTDFLIHTAENELGLDKTSMEILIKLDYFEEFGTIDNLLSIYSLFKKEYNSKRTQKTKDKKVELLREYERTVDIETSIFKKMKYQIEVLGYTDIICPEFSDNLVFVIGIETNQYGTPFGTFYQVNTGSTVEGLKMNKFFYEKNHIKAGDLILLGKINNQKKAWIKDREEFELVLSNYREVVEE